jgi:hypothetical protein
MLRSLFNEFPPVNDDHCLRSFRIAWRDSADELSENDLTE